MTGRTFFGEDRRCTLGVTAHLLTILANQHSPPEIVLLDPEGPQFVSITSLNTISADTNAAVTIGMHVLLDPDWVGSWSHVATENGTVLADKVAGAEPFRGLKKLPGFVAGKAGIVNAWRHRSLTPFAEDRWLPTGAYFAEVRETIARNLRLQLDRKAATA